MACPRGTLPLVASAGRPAACRLAGQRGYTAGRRRHRSMPPEEILCGEGDELRWFFQSLGTRKAFSSAHIMSLVPYCHRRCFRSSMAATNQSVLSFSLCLALSCLCVFVRVTVLQATMLLSIRTVRGRDGRRRSSGDVAVDVFFLVVFNV